MRPFVILTLLLFRSECANILGLFPYPAHSHQLVFQKIWRELSLTGHQVTVVTPNPLNDPSLTNLTEISLDFISKNLEKYSISKALSVSPTGYDTFRNLQSLMNVVNEDVLSSTQFQKLISHQTKFDLVLVQLMQPAYFSLGVIFEAPVVVISSATTSEVYNRFNIPNHPILYPEFLLDLSSSLTLWQKIQSVGFSLWIEYYHNVAALSIADQMAKKYIRPDVPCIGEVQKNVSMFLLNQNFFFDAPKPMVPLIIDISLIHTTSPKSLPKDLQQILDEASEGVVYVSFGTNVKSSRFNEQTQNDIFQAFSELPYKVFFKWDSDRLPEIPPNIIVRKWFPQPDILAHPNVRVFVTQGGIQSAEEAISKEVPMVAVPFQFDQPRNVRRVVDLGIGEKINPGDLTKDKLKETIIQVAENRSYKDRIKEVRRVLFDKNAIGLKKVVWWLEYVIRNKGSPFLKAQIVEISWFQYLLLDIILIVGLLIFIFYEVCKMIIRKIREKCHHKKAENK